MYQLSVELELDRSDCGIHFKGQCTYILKAQRIRKCQNMEGISIGLYVQTESADKA